MSATRRRVVATVDRAEGGATTLGFTQRLLEERAPQVIQANELHWSSNFRIHHRLASQCAPVEFSSPEMRHIFIARSEGRE